MLIIIIKKIWEAAIRTICQDYHFYRGFNNFYAGNKQISDNLQFEAWL